MEYSKDDKQIFIVLSKGEELFEALLQVAKKEGLRAGHFTGIGAVDHVDLAYFDTENKEYKRKVFDEEYELVNLHGNLTLLAGGPFLHIHGTIADNEYHAFAGHFFSAKVAVTCEIAFTAMDMTLERKMNDKIGLNLICGLTTKL